MRVVEALARIRPVCISRITPHLARGEELRENMQLLLEHFFDMLHQCVETGEPGWLEPVLEEWVSSRTQTELEARVSNLLPVLDRILQTTIEVGRETLEAPQALALVETVLPFFLHAFSYTAAREMDFNIRHISHQLELAKATLERLDRSKSDFIAIAAHELKTPLTLIEGYAAMLRDSLPEKSETASPAIILLKGMDNGARRLREIIDDMIDVSLIDNNLLALHYQPVWLDRLLGVLRNEFEPVAQERQLLFEVHAFPGSEEMTFGDEERLYQAFRNLISNSIKYTPDGGVVKVGGRKLPGFLEIVVADSGIGIALEDQNRIFEKFGRLGNVSLHSSGKTKFKGGGPGLGLPITKGIIEAHGGAIWVESDGLDEVRCPGSTFHVMLPIRKIPPDDKAARLFRPLAEADSSRVT